MKPFLLQEVKNKGEKHEPAILETSAFPCSLQILSNKFCTTSWNGDCSFVLFGLSIILDVVYCSSAWFKSKSKA